MILLFKVKRQKKTIFPCLNVLLAVTCFPCRWKTDAFPVASVVLIAGIGRAENENFQKSAGFALKGTNPAFHFSNQIKKKRGRREKEFSVVSILIGKADMASWLEEFSDRVAVSSDLMDEKAHVAFEI